MRIRSQRVLFDGPSGFTIRPAEIECEGPWIQSLSETTDRAVDHDFGDRLVTPAFINGHTHLALGMMRGLDQQQKARGNLVEDLFYALESKLTAEDVRAFARMGAFESLSFGVGLVWDHYYFGVEIAEALLETGLAGVVAPTLQDLGGPGVEWLERTFDETRVIDDTERFRTGGVFAAVGPHATDTVSDALWSRCLDLAEERQLPLHAHLAQSIEELRRIQEREGRTPTAWLADLGVLERAPHGVFAHALYVGRADLERIERSRSTLVACPYSQLQFGFPAPVRRWSEAGVRWAAATDCSVSNDSMNVQKELRFLFGQRTVGTAHGPTYERFFEAPTLDHAEALWSERRAEWDRAAPHTEVESLLSRVWRAPGSMHPGFRAGTIQDGALASLLVWDTEHPTLWPAEAPLRPLALADPAAAIHALIVAGRPVGEPGRFAASIRESEGYKNASTEAGRRRVELLKRAGVP